jgi:hypothetical protein
MFPRSRRCKDKRNLTSHLITQAYQNPEIISFYPASTTRTRLHGQGCTMPNTTTTGASLRLMRNVSVLPNYISRTTFLTLSLLMSYIYIYIYTYIYGAPSKARNLTSYIYGRDFVLGILLLEPCISLIYARKTNKYTNYSFSLFIMHGSSYMFRHYIAIFRERS